MKVLLLGAHCDDIELGLGATLNKNRNWDTTAVVAAANNHEEFSRNALSSLGVKNQHYGDFKIENFLLCRQAIYEYLEPFSETDPDVIFVTAPDHHEDHIILYEKTIRLFHNSSILTYRPSIRNNPNFFTDTYEQVSKEDLEAKMAAISVYPFAPSKAYMQESTIFSHASLAGVYIQQEFAEAFRTFRRIGV
jgi:LmbE family N-acetylglucosaminyl deacetylase